MMRALLGNKARRRHRFDLALCEDRSSYCLAALIGVFAFLACLAFGMALALNHYARTLDGAGTGHFTVEVEPLDSQDSNQHAIPPLDTRTSSALELLRASSAVSSAAILSDAQIAALLQPWLGDLATLKSDLPLPRLIDVTLSPWTMASGTGDGEKAIEALRASLMAAVPGVTLDDHALVLSHTVALTQNLSLLAFLSVVLISFAVMIAIVFLVHSSLAIHHKTIGLLHLIGATDAYIAHQFAMFASRLAMLGAGCGTAAALAAAGLLFFTQPSSWFLSVFDWHWISLPLLPLLFVGLSRIVAWLSVMLLLRRLP